MPKLIFAILLFALPSVVSAQVFNQNQVVVTPYQGWVNATSTSGGSKLNASTTPYFANFFATNGNITNLTVSNCTGCGARFPFTPTLNYGALTNATGTPVWFQAGLQASSTSHFFNADFNSATSSAFAVTGSSTVSGQFNAVGGATFGNITVSSCTGCGGVAFPFTPTLNYAALTNATNTPVWFQAGLQASSTSHFVDMDLRNATSTGIIYLSDGSVASPSLTFTNEAGNNSGFYLSGSNNDIGLAIAGSAKFRFDSTGLGIGAPGAPAYAIDVYRNGSGIQSVAGYSNTQAAAVGVGMEIDFNATSVRQGTFITAWEQANTNASYFSFGTRTNGALTQKWRFDSLGNFIPEAVNQGGKVGIGTTSPLAKLAVHANNGETNLRLFEIASSTATATTTLFGVSNTGVLTTVLADGCVQVSSLVLTSTGSACGSGGGGTSDEKWATSTLPTRGIYPNSATYVGIGTTTPRFNLQLASSTAPQLSLTYDALNPHWVFSNIGGNLFLATSSPNTFATSTGGTNPSIQFPANGGCVGCSDLYLAGGLNLRNAKHVSATSSNPSANVLQTIYTTPTGRRAILMGYSVNNQHTAGVSVSVRAVISSVPYKLAATSSPAANSQANQLTGFVLEPGETLAVLQDTASARTTVFANLIEYSSDTPLFSARSVSPTTATTSFYTVPTGKTAWVSGGSSLIGSNVFGVTVDNETASTITGKMFVVKPGATAVDGMNNIEGPNTWVGASTVAVRTLANFSGMAMNSGESLQYSINNATTLLWSNIYER